MLAKSSEVIISLILYYFCFNILVALCIVTVSVSSTTPVDLLSLLLDAEVQSHGRNSSNITVVVPYHKDYLNHYGADVDKFLGPRPWWEVKSEPYAWQNIPEGKDVQVILRRLPSRDYDYILEHISRRQYPEDCGDTRLQVTVMHGFASFGNNFYNINNAAAQTHFAVYVPYIDDPQTKATNFLDPHYCPKKHNKFECAFLPPTNCTIPKLTSISSRYFSNATASAVEISLPMFQKHKRNSDAMKVHEKQPPLPGSIYGGLVEEYGPTSTTHKHNTYQLFFTYAFLFRLNYDFRGRVANETMRFEKSLPPSASFPTDGNCVAINMRKDPDRAPEGINVTEYCQNCAKGIIECSFTAFHNYGCHTANPYGAIKFEDFIQGAKVVSNATFLYVTTDNNKWLIEALQNYSNPDGLTIVPYAAPPQHRKSSCDSGVQYISAILLARKCSAFVGNTGSAVTAFFMNLLCVQHNKKLGGECPPLFDFSRRLNVIGVDPAWTKYPQNTRIRRYF